MSTNPNNAVGTNAAYDGRTSVKAFNDGIGAYSMGILSGWACSPNTGMTVSLGGDGTTRDIAIAEDVAGNKTTINNISEAPISVTMSAAPATNSRIDLIVAYVDNPPQGSSTSVDNPGACGLIKVDGTAAADPVAPNDSAIRTAITADGASGSTAYYVVLATITIASGTTDLASDNIAAGPSAGIGSQNIDFTTLPLATIGEQLVSLGNIDTYTNYVSPYTGFLCGKAGSLHQGQAFIQIGGQHVAGIPFNDAGTNVQVSFCIPVRKGQTVEFVVTGDSEFQALAIRAYQYAI